MTCYSKLFDVFVTWKYIQLMRICNNDLFFWIIYRYVSIHSHDGKKITTYLTLYIRGKRYILLPIMFCDLNTYLYHLFNTLYYNYSWWINIILNNCIIHVRIHFSLAQWFSWNLLLRASNVLQLIIVVLCIVHFKRHYVIIH